MFNVKMRGQTKAAPITKGLAVYDRTISSEKGVEIALRVYTPSPQEENLPVMI
jgi:hypothetical protein